MHSHGFGIVRPGDTTPANSARVPSVSFVDSTTPSTPRADSLNPPQFGPGSAALYVDDLPPPMPPPAPTKGSSWLCHPPYHPGSKTSFFLIQPRQFSLQSPVQCHRAILPCGTTSPTPGLQQRCPGHWMSTRPPPPTSQSIIHQDLSVQHPIHAHRQSFE
jgi:hypothetical protein